jgi:hypothetical protein
VRRIAVLKAWTDQRRSPVFDPEAFIDILEPSRFRWEDLNGLVPRKHHSDRERICKQVRERFAALSAPTDLERNLLADQTAHREHSLYERLRDEARAAADELPR